MAEGRTQELAAAVTSILAARGLSVPGGLSEAVAGVPRDTVVAAALACADAADFRRRLGAQQG